MSLRSSLKIAAFCVGSLAFAGSAQAVSFFPGTEDDVPPDVTADSLTSTLNGTFDVTDPLSFSGTFTSTSTPFGVPSITNISGDLLGGGGNELDPGSGPGEDPTLVGVTFTANFDTNDLANSMFEILDTNDEVLLAGTLDGIFLDLIDSASNPGDPSDISTVNLRSTITDGRADILDAYTGTGRDGIAVLIFAGELEGNLFASRLDIRGTRFIPLPATLPLMVTGLIGAGVYFRRRRLA